MFAFALYISSRYREKVACSKRSSKIIQETGTCCSLRPLSPENQLWLPIMTVSARYGHSKHLKVSLLSLFSQKEGLPIDGCVCSLCPHSLKRRRPLNIPESFWLQICSRQVSTSLLQYLSFWRPSKATCHHRMSLSALSIFSK